MNECSVEYVVLWGMFYLKNMNGALFIKFHRENLETACDLLPGAVLFPTISASGSMDMVEFQRPRLLQAEYVTNPLVRQGPSGFLVAFGEAVRLALDLTRILRRAHL